MWDELNHLSNGMENVTGFRSCYARVLFRQKQERASHLFILFLFWMQLFLARCHPLSFLFSSILPFFLPSLHFIQFHLTILTHTRSYNWTRTWCTITGSIKFISGTDVFSLLYIFLSLSLTHFLSHGLFILDLFCWDRQQNLVFVFDISKEKPFQICLVVCRL